MSGGRSWTTGEVRRLNEMRAKRFKATDIARELGRTIDAIYSFLRYVPATPSEPARLKPTERLHEWSRDDVQQLREMALFGASAQEVAAALGRAVYGVRCKASRENIRFGNRGKHSVCRVERETNHYKRDAIEGSDKLLHALLDMVA